MLCYICFDANIQSSVKISYKYTSDTYNYIKGKIILVTLIMGT